MTRHPIFFSFLGVLAIAAFNGCGDDSKPPPDPDKYPSITQFCNAIAEVQCNETVASNCNLPAPGVQGCVGAVQNKCYNGKSDLTKNFNIEKYNPKKAEPCINKIKEVFADASLDLADLGAVETACAPTFSLGAAAGFDCQRDADCAEGSLKCFYTAPGVASCEVATPVSGGSNCQAPGSLCPAAQFCFKSVDAGQICKDKQVQGQKCAPVAAPCDPSNFCQTPPPPAAGETPVDPVCGPKYKAGQSCTEDQQCAEGKCTVVFNRANPTGAGICLQKIIFAPNESYCDNFRPD